MLWRVRATLPDRPGSLAVLATECGASEVNILGFQIFPSARTAELAKPAGEREEIEEARRNGAERRGASRLEIKGVDLVTDELVLDTPEGWTTEAVAALVERSGGTAVSMARCTEAALADQPTRYVQAAAAVLAAPASFPDVLARLFDAEAEPATGDGELDVLDVTVASVLVQVRRTAPFTATEHARAAALAGLVDDVLARAAAAAPVTAPTTAGSDPELVTDGNQVTALVDGASVGSAAIRPALDEPESCVLTLSVDPAWRRRGIGSRLLAEAVRLAATREAAELVVTTHADNQAVLPMVLAAGLRGRIRMSGDRLTVRIPLAAMQR